MSDSLMNYTLFQDAFLKRYEIYVFGSRNNKRFCWSRNWGRSTSVTISERSSVKSRDQIPPRTIAVRRNTQMSAREFHRDGHSRRLISDLVHLIADMPVRRSRAYTHRTPTCARARVRTYESGLQRDAQSNATQCNAAQLNATRAPASRWWNGALRGNLTYDILKASRPLVGVCWNVGMSDGFCVGHGILHLARYEPYDGRDRWLRVWKPPCEVRAIRDTRARVCVRAYVRARRVYVYRRVHRNSERDREEDRACSVLSRGIAPLRGRTMEMNFLKRDGSALR